MRAFGFCKAIYTNLAPLARPLVILVACLYFEGRLFISIQYHNAPSHMHEIIQYVLEIEMFAETETESVDATG